MGCQMNARSQEILKAVIGYYIATADPVGSRTLSKRFSFGLSPATIRNIMADLEEMGFLCHPYTSAGRVPTEQGYRFYVDNIANSIFLTMAEKKKIEEYCLRLSNSPEKLFEDASKMISRATHYIGIVLAPRLKNIIFEHINFVRLREKKVLATLVSQSGLLQQRIVESDEDLPQHRLDQMTNYLNEKFKGLSLSQIRKELLRLMKKEKRCYDRLLSDALRLSQEVITAEDRNNVYIQGQTNILDHPEFADLEKMKTIFKTFDEKGQLVKLLDKYMSVEGVQILIGSETQIEEMKNCTLISATYKVGDRIRGSLGVIGPTRMPYTTVIPLVEYIAVRVSNFLSDT